MSQRLDPNVYYARDMDVIVNDVLFKGVAVPKKAATYHIKVKTPGVISMITVRSCHREFTFEPDKSFWSSGKKYEFDYTPNQLEKSSGCPIDIGAYEDSTSGRHSWAIIFFSSAEKIQARLECNGGTLSTSGGISACQAHAGTLQAIHFDHRVKVSPDNERCNVMKTLDEKDYQYIIAPEECAYYFCDQIGECHRLTTLGYTGLLVRKVSQ